MKNTNPNSKKTVRSGKPRGKRAPYSHYKGSKQDRRAEEIADDAAAMSRSNPISTYTKYSTFASDAAKLPFSYPLGYQYETLFKGSNAVNVISDENDFVVPGIMALRFSTGPGVSKDFTSAINRSSIQFWTYLRSVQKAAGSYDHQDITMMMLALDSCLMFHSMLKRIYGLLPDVTPLNKYYAKAMVNAAGVDYDDVVKNIQDFRAYINEFAYRLKQYAIPNGIELINRHRWMCEGVYTDSPSTRAQSYIFVPLGFWVYDNTVETGSQLSFSYWAWDQDDEVTQLLSFQSIMAYGNTLINAISGDEDFAMISGDLFTLYNGHMLELEYIGENYQILPKYDEIVLSQIENATIVGLFHSSYTPVISQNPNVNAGAIIYQPMVDTQTKPDLYGDVAINFHHDEPTSDQVIEATRLTAVQTVATPGYAKTAITTFGTELVHGVEVYTLQPTTDASRRALWIRQRKFVYDLTNDTDTVIEINSSILQLAQFDWAPRIEIFQNYGTNDAANGPFHIIGVSWDIDNLSDVAEPQLAIINDACLWSEFDIPQGSAGRK